MPTPRAQKKQTAILDVATRLFLERGYDAVSLDDILEVVGGSKATLYSYYGGKEGLFAATVQNTCKCKLASFESLDLTRLDPKAGLTTIGKQFLRAISDPYGRSMFRAMVAEAERFPQLAAAFFQAGPEAVILLVRRSIEHWQARGLLRRGNAEALAIQFLGLMMGNFHLKSLLGIAETLTDREIHAWVTRSVDLFLDGALVRQSEPARRKQPTPARD
jgi:TetR/AcrR family transcriptional regulator, mexJK operon transcriptional repressor